MPGRCGVTHGVTPGTANHVGLVGISDCGITVTGPSQRRLECTRPHNKLVLGEEGVTPVANTDL
jgi:hypothetical protein